MEGRSSNIVSGPALVTNETNSIGLPFFAKWVGTTRNVRVECVDMGANYLCRKFRSGRSNPRLWQKLTC